MSEKITTTHGLRVELGIREQQQAERLEQRPPLDAFEARHNRLEAIGHRREAARLMEPPEGLVGEGSTEVVSPIKTWPTKTNERFYIIDTLENPNVINVDASEMREVLALRANCLSLALDTAQTVKASNSVEKMYAHQIAIGHMLGMRFAAQLENGPSMDPIMSARTMAAAAMAFDVSQKAGLALHKFKTGGTQRVEVQYQQVNVSEGGQAVVTGKVSTKRRGRVRATGGGAAK